MTPIQRLGSKRLPDDRGMTTDVTIVEHLKIHGFNIFNEFTACTLNTFILYDSICKKKNFRRKRSNST